MPNEEQDVDLNNEEVEEEATEEVESEDTTEKDEEETKVEKKPKRTPEDELSFHERRAKQLRKKLGKEGKEDVEVKTPQKNDNKSGELDETQLDYLDIKGITEDEDIAVIHSVMKKTGQTVRQALKDEYVIAKLKNLKTARDVKNATPSSSKRSGQQATDNEDYYFQKYEATGELPKGMPAGMASKLVRRKASQDDVHRNPFE